MSARRDTGAWFRQPVVWLGALILAATIVGCMAMIVLAWRYPDPPVANNGGQAIHVPLRHAADATPPARETR
ncbi:MAG TPA: hypothetical protein VKG21_10920 [Casimicrobiaceae bacterium]|nr:hypothetical protein [Casimicrobiaceae bacterium]